jgi:hypothetical protein
MAAELVRIAESEAEDKPERLRWWFLIYSSVVYDCIFFTIVVDMALLM